VDIDARSLECLTVWLRVMRLGEDLTQAILRDVDVPAIATNVPFIIVFGLYLDGPLRPSAIARLTGLTSGGVSGALERLEGLGIVHRDFGEVAGDRRAVVVRLTAKGHRTVLHVAQLLDAAIDGLLHDLAGPIGRRRPLLAEPLAVVTARAIDHQMISAGPPSAVAPDTVLARRARENLAIFVRMVRLGEQILRERPTEPGQALLDENVSALTLGHLQLRGSMRPGEIAVATGLTSGGVSGMLDRLEAAGFITRELGSVPGDRRAVVVHLTDAGRRYVAEAMARHVPRIEDLLDEFVVVLDYRAAAGDPEQPTA
jgi:DNA-binding MarR family transcriptional regulator